MVKKLSLDDRKLLVLSTIVNEYIRTGEPVGSKTIIANSKINVSSATVRNDMAALEKLGLLEQPHTSAGRIPTYLGYRLYIERLMHPHVLSAKEKREIDEQLTQNGITAENVVDNAVQVLSDLTQLTVVNSNNMPHFSVITRVEVIPAGRRLYALLIITSTGAIKNKICRLEFDLTNEQLGFFAEFVNKNLTGTNIEELTPAMLQNLAIALGSYMISLSPLLYAVYELSEEFTKNSINIRGEQRLLEAGNMNSTEIIRFLNEKQELARLLSNAFSGIKVIFGKENDTFSITNSSMVVSPYKIGEAPGGSLGIIGPLRLDYAKVIPYMQYFSESVTKLLSDILHEEEK
ncbi:heat-inducible transcriptional repressor HrcA [Massiliimalia massiliensis]|uniref:heat-inducible transcriptional repressor HrcA n=1 Tax=Massiliimalia massiliensis TaxID=1852384 RepID=UPI001E3CB564|nr:heat-inducible transcriptional repressor HrcA [Massiliimalia massiliensis]